MGILYSSKREIQPRLTSSMHRETMKSTSRSARYSYAFTPSVGSSVESASMYSTGRPKMPPAAFISSMAIWVVLWLLRPTSVARVPIYPHTHGSTTSSGGATSGGASGGAAAGLPRQPLIRGKLIASTTISAIGITNFSNPLFILTSPS